MKDVKVVYKSRPKLARASSEHMEHLRNIAFGGLMKTIIPSHVQEEFLKKGYVRKVVGGLIITEEGHKALTGK